MNTGVILMISGAVCTGIGLLIMIAEAALAPKRKRDIRKRMQEKY